jgi:hypothetical protein
MSKELDRDLLRGREVDVRAAFAAISGDTATAHLGSAPVTVRGDKLLLDGDKIDTCSGGGAKAGSTVIARASPS